MKSNPPSFLFSPVVGVVLAIVLTGCARAPVVEYKPTPKAYTARDYDTVYRRWTRGENAFSYGNLTDVLNVTATFESWDFRWAYIVRYASDHHLTVEQRDDMLSASLEDARHYHRFFVTLSGDEERENNLTGSSPAWRVLLVDEKGNQHPPIEIQRIRRPNAVQRTYFSSVSPFRQTFRVTFPVQKQDGTPLLGEIPSSALLRFAGALGTVDLSWKFTTSP